MGTVTDDFDRADSGSLGASWTEIDTRYNHEISSNQAQAAASEFPVARYDTALGHEDMTVEVTVTAYDSTYTAGVLGRLDSGRNTGIGFFVKNQATSTYRILTFDGTNFALVGTAVDTTAPTPPFTIKLEISGRILRGYVDDTLVIQRHDTTYPTGQMAGIYSGHSSVRLNDWTAYNSEQTQRQVVRFGIVSDVHFNSTRSPVVGGGGFDNNYQDGDDKLSAAVTVLNAADPALDFVVSLGDFWEAEDGDTTADLDTIEAVYDDLTMTRYYVFGNHDLDSDSKSVYQGRVGMSSDYYSFDVGDYHFVVLDGCHYADDNTSNYDNWEYQQSTDPGALDIYDCYVNPAQRTWLTTDLANTSKDEVIVFIHFAIDGLNANYPLANAAAVRTILENAGNVRAVFQGHRHENVNGWVNGIEYFGCYAMTDEAHPTNAYAIVQIGG